MSNQYERKCPQCDSLMGYKSAGALKTAVKNNGVCRKCASLNSGFTKRYATEGKNTGKDNAFYGRQHTQETKEKIGQRDNTTHQSEAFQQKMSMVTSGKNNPMYGKRVFDIWVEKYGAERAKELEQQWKERLSVKFSGKNNPMYNKPTPKGAGNGWKGWYKSHYFRSLRELCFMIDLDNKGLIWKTGETISIKYLDYNGKHRTYRPDFIVGNTIYEIKPLRLITSPSVQAKSRAAEQYCKENKLSYKIMDVDIDVILIKYHLDNNGNINFDRDYKERFEQWQK